MPKKILIINTGGTLSSVKSSKGLVPGMRSDDMLEELRMVSRNLELETEDFCSLDSANIGIPWHIHHLCWHLCYRI